MRSTSLVGLGLVGIVGGYWAAFERGETSRRREVLTAGGYFPCTVASITDGDTLRCVERGADGRPIRVRLSGIAARERDGSCAPGHPCPDASAEAATAALSRLASGRVLRCEGQGETYGRIAAFCRTEAGVDLSCAMVASGTALRWDRYWRGHRC